MSIISCSASKQTSEQSGLYSDVERVMGIEPTQPAWKAGVLPLYYTRLTREVYHQPRNSARVIFLIPLDLRVTLTITIVIEEHKLQNATYEPDVNGEFSFTDTFKEPSSYLNLCAAGAVKARNGNSFMKPAPSKRVSFLIDTGDRRIR